MPKKTSAAENTTPKTVGERRRNIRAARAPASGPKLAKAKAEVDLTQPNARKLLAGLHPRPTNETLLDATPALERAALDYVGQRDAESAAAEGKEVSGNILCNAIGKNLGVRGDGWQAVWDVAKGNVDWAGVVKELGISDEVIAKHRLPEKRVLKVTEIAEQD